MKTPNDMTFEELMRKSTPGPFYVEAIRNEDGEYSEGGPEASRGFDAYAIVNGNFRVMFDSLNRSPDLSLIEEDRHEEGTDAWDVQSKVDAELIARLLLFAHAGGPTAMEKLCRIGYSPTFEDRSAAHNALSRLSGPKNL